MPIKLAITGQFRRGKDTVADYVASKLMADNVARLAFADALKRELSAMVCDYTVSYEQLPMHRGKLYSSGAQGSQYSTIYTRHPQFDIWMRGQREVNGVGWQWWGEFRRQFNGEDYWINHPDLQWHLKIAEDNGQHIIITDMRHHNEAQWCRDHGFKTWRVYGPCRAESETRDASHPSERDVPLLPVDHDIANDGSLALLYAQVDNLLEYVLSNTNKT